MAQHLPEQPPHYRIDIEAGEFAMAIETWIARYMHTQQEREFTLSEEEYISWYWNITCRYVIRAIEPPTAPPVVADPYTPRAPLERNVVRSTYSLYSNI